MTSPSPAIAFPGLVDYPALSFFQSLHRGTGFF
ncbi:hypothetical protein ECTW09098_2429, partial [Escherichia coli TW09098]